MMRLPCPEEPCVLTLLIKGFINMSLVRAMERNFHLSSIEDPQGDIYVEHDYRWCAVGR